MSAIYILAQNFYSMKPILCLILAAALFTTANAQKAKGYYLQEGTIVEVMTTEAIDSKSAQEGQTIYLEVADDVQVNGKTVIASGSIVKGEITEASKAKMMGKAGKIDFTIDYVKAIDGTNIRVRSAKSFSGKNKQGGVIAAAVIVSPVALFIKGKDVTIEKGKKFRVYVDKDYAIDPSNPKG
jgi:formate dehydrogenase assembly factor FdhD